MEHKNKEDVENEREKVTGHLKNVKGIYHLVLNYYDENGKRKTPSITTKLPVRGIKNKQMLCLNI